MNLPKKTAGVFDYYAEKLTKLAKLYGEDNVVMGERQYYRQNDNICFIPVKLKDHAMKRNGINYLADKLEI